MSKISLEKFIEKTKGTCVDVPWVNKPSNLKGQCVSLIQWYIKDCLEQPAKARGHAKTWQTSYVNEGLGKIVTEPRKGDILVFPEQGIINGIAYGHLAIYIDSNTMYDQNNSTHDNGCAGYSKIFPNYIILRPNVTLIEDVKVEEKLTQSTTKYLNLSPTADTWRVYPLNKQPVAGNECGFAYPSRFGGLSYTILRYISNNVVVIKTRDWGEVQIYIAHEKATVTDSPIYGLVN